MNIKKSSKSLVEPKVKDELYALMEELYPICRSITGNGVRKTLKILKKKIPLKIIEVPTGTKVFDWKIPLEWNIKDAYVKNSQGKRIIDFKKSNIHLLNYSVPINKKITQQELKLHLHTLADKPNSIPYVTSYYKKNWGFSVAHNQLESFNDDYYDVKIDSSLKPGSLTYGEFLKKGKISDEILISTYVCHPSLCNDNLSGVVVSTILANILSKIDTYFSYRFIFVPETIGTITWLSKNQKNLSKIKGGLVITCVGDDGNFTYKKTKHGNSTIDKIINDIFKQSKRKTKTKDFFPYGSDERQFCSPGINLDVGVFMRTPYYEFKEYHTADDNLKFVSKTALKDSLSMLLKIISAIEITKNIEQYSKIKKIENKKSDIYLNLKPKCEPQLGKRKLYRNISKRRLVGKDNSQDLIEISILWILNYSDGNYSLNDISKISGLPIKLLKHSSQLLLKKSLLKKLN
jgi:aminopeptidase-like protein